MILRRVSRFRAWQGYKPPRTREEAERRIDDLLAKSSKVLDLLHGDSLVWADSGAKLTVTEEMDWRREACIYLAKGNTEMTDLRAWIKARRSVALDGPTSSELVELLKLSAPVMRRMYERGAVFTAEEVEAMSRAEQIFQGKPLPERLRVEDLLRGAKDCMAGSIQNQFQIGAMIAMATRESEDLDHLRKLYTALPRFSANDTAIAYYCMPHLILALAHGGHFLEAANILQGVNHGEVSFCWLHIARFSGDLTAIRRVREFAARTSDPRQFAWLALRTYEVTHDEKDIERIVSRVTKGEVFKGSKDRAMFLLTVAKEYLSQDRASEARSLLGYFGQEADRRIRGLAYMYIETGSSGDYGALVSALNPTDVTSAATVQRIVYALSVHGYVEIARQFTTILSDPLLRCTGFSVLSMIPGVDQFSLLDEAEREYFSAEIKATTNEDIALETFALAEARGGRMGTAACVAGLIRERETRCRAMLILYVISRGEEVPAFIRDRYV